MSGFKYGVKDSYSVHFMPILTKTQGRVESTATIRILEQKADFAQSKAQGTLLTLEEVPEFLKTRMKELENTAFCRKNGYVWFYLDTVGTELHGTYQFYPEAKSLQEMLKPVIESVYHDLPCDERVRFFAGEHPLMVYVGLNPDIHDWRVDVYGNYKPNCAAPLVVTKEVQSEPGGIKKLMDAVRRAA